MLYHIPSVNNINTYTINFPVDTMANINDNTNYIFKGKYDINLSSLYSQIIPKENILILTNERYNSLVLEQLPLVKQEQIILEPAMRNTAPCILYASLKIKKQNPNAVVVVAPSDHWIEDEQTFSKNVQQAFDFCSENPNEYLLEFVLGMEPEDITDEFERMKSHTEYIDREGYLLD